MTLVHKLQSRLTRVTSSGKVIGEIDGLRFVAIVPVIIFHVRNYLIVKPVTSYSIPVTQDWAARLGQRGHYGVQLFFIISGFVLALPFASHHLKRLPTVDLKKYFIRRLTRLEPPYLIAMAGCFLMLVMLRGEADRLLPHLAAGLGYLHSFIYGFDNPINLVTWSLEIEVQFYLLVPLLATVFAIRGPALRRSLVCVLCILISFGQVLFMPTVGRLSLSIVNYLQYFLAGFLFADLYLNELKEWASRRHPVWDLISIIGWPLLVLICAWTNVARVLFAPLAVFLFCAVFSGRLTNRIFTNRWITVVGGMCYTIYLIHFQIISAMERLIGELSWTSSFGLNLLLHLGVLAPILLVSSAIYFVLIERPCMTRNWPTSLKARALAVFSRPRDLGNVEGT